jgi:RNA polymerase sigma factor (sigma-70 family)
VDEKTLISLCVKGDLQSQKSLFYKYSPTLFKVARRYSTSKEHAEDVLQEAWLKIFNALVNYIDNGKLEAWLKTIVINTALRSGSKAYFKYESNGIDDLEEGYTFPDAIPSMHYDEIIQLIDKLPPGYAEVFKLAILDEYNHKEIGAMLNIAESTSRVKLSEARKRIQKMIEINDKYYCNAK